ncbi:MAG TPA: hypothetical protein VKY65_18770 [Alphaproteobacteria bacterium]|nr:hypothetical protein [Alphaproteobacteria bacterium]
MLEPEPEDGKAIIFRGQKFIARDGIYRAEALLSAAQAQTSEAFGFKWHQRDTFESEASLRAMREWLRERYGDVATWLPEHGERPILLDAGCGAAMSAIELFGPLLKRTSYLGVDVPWKSHRNALRNEVFRGLSCKRIS